MKHNIPIFIFSEAPVLREFLNDMDMMEVFCIAIVNSQYKNFDSSNKTARDFYNLYTKYHIYDERGAIDLAFNWDSTHQGHNFWSRVSQLWEDYYDNEGLSEEDEEF